MEIRFDNKLILTDPATRKEAEFPAVKRDGFRARPQLLHLAHCLGYREDAGETAVIQRALDYVEARATEVMYPELRSMQFLPAIDVPLGARTFTFAVKDRVGRARRTAPSGRDLPRANITLSENTAAIAGYGDEYAYTTDELRAFSYWNGTGRGPALSLDTERADVAMQMIAREIDLVIAFGDPEDARIKGFLNHSAITPATGSYDWLAPATTYAQMLAELLAIANDPVTASKEVFKPDTILLPTAHLLAAQALQNAQGTRSVLQAFNDAMEAAGRKVDVQSWPLLNGTTLNGTDMGGTFADPRAVAFVRKPAVVGHATPALFIAQPPQARGLEWVIPCEGLTGGCIIKQPLGVYYRNLLPH